MPWWTKVADRPIERHETLLDAAIRVNFAVNVGAVPVDACGIYACDPRTRANEKNLLPAYLARASRRQKRRR